MLYQLGEGLPEAVQKDKHGPLQGIVAQRKATRPPLVLLAAYLRYRDLHHITDPDEGSGIEDICQHWYPGIDVEAQSARDDVGRWLAEAVLRRARGEDRGDGLHYCITVLVYYCTIVSVYCTTIQ